MSAPLHNGLYWWRLPAYYFMMVVQRFQSQSNDSGGDAGMWPATKVTERLHITYPIIQAGMAGGAATPELAAAVSNAGGLGSLGAGYMTPEQIRQAVRRIRSLTDRPFAVNLFMEQSYEVSEQKIEAARIRLEPFREELGIGGRQPAIAKYGESAEEQMQVLLEERVPVFSFTFGLPSPEWISRFREAGTVRRECCDHGEQ